MEKEMKTRDEVKIKGEEIATDVFGSVESAKMCFLDAFYGLRNEEEINYALDETNKMSMKISKRDYVKQYAEIKQDINKLSREWLLHICMCLGVCIDELAKKAGYDPEKYFDTEEKIDNFYLWMSNGNIGAVKYSESKVFPKENDVYISSILTLLEAFEENE